ncbi:MAG: hypothetical protein ACI92W_000191 [Paraglaciecola sp.]|jgi:hypothetical protein
MKTTIIFCLTLLVCIGCETNSSNQTSDGKETNSDVEIQKVDLLGAWEADEKTDSGTVITHMITFTEKYFSEAIYVKEPAQFIWTLGGSWELVDNNATLNYEFFSLDTAQVGQQGNMDLKLVNGKMEASGRTWKKVDDGTPGELQGAWLITGRKRNGEMSRRTPGERKTMKILSGTRFQWIAYHTGTGKFSGTGGGSYTTTDGQYTENIDFFSRNNARVGASLEFQYRLDSGEWHHEGTSSKGDPIYEIWTPRTMLED